MKNIKCLLGFHDFKQVGGGLPSNRKFTFLSVSFPDIGIRETFDIIYCTRCQLAIMKRTTNEPMEHE